MEPRKQGALDVGGAPGGCADPGTRSPRRWSPHLLPLGDSDGRLNLREWVLLAFGALALTVFVCLVEPGIFTSTDWLELHVFYKTYLRSAVLHGRLPLWNPHALLGRPMLADSDSAFFYPPDIVYLLFDVHLACAIACALHLLVGLVGMVKLARAVGIERGISFGVALVFAAGAPVVGCFTSGYIHYGPAICLLPLVFYLGMRLQVRPGYRTVAILGLVLGLQQTCGHPQAAWLTSLGLVVFLFARRLERDWRCTLAGLGRDALGLMLAGGIGLALAAVSLLPLMELAGQSNRQAASLAFSGTFAEPLIGWATLLVPTDPHRFHFQANAQLYAGAATALFGLCGLARWRDRNMRALLMLATFCALLAAGETTPVFRILFHVVPGVSLFRIHSRATLLVTLALVLAAGVFLSRPAPRPRAEIVRLLLVGLVSLGLAVAFVLAWPGFGDSASRVAGERAALIMGNTVLGALWLSRSWGARGRRGLAAVFALLLALDLGPAIVALKQQNRGADYTQQESLVRHALVVVGQFGASGVPPRVFLPTLRGNAGMQQGWSAPFGYASLNLGRVWNAIHDTVGIVAPLGHNTFPSLELARLGPFPYSSMGLVMGANPQSKRPVLNPAPDARAYIARSARLVRDAGEAVALMRGGHDFHGTALVEQALALPHEAVGAEGHATIMRFEPERITIAVDSPANALLVVAEPWYPGWSASVDGKPAPCVPANAWMRAVPVPAGKSEVVLTFRSTYLLTGAMISLTMLGIIMLLLMRRRSARAK